MARLVGAVLGHRASASPTRTGSEYPSRIGEAARLEEKVFAFFFPAVPSDSALFNAFLDAKKYCQWTHRHEYQASDVYGVIR